MTKGLATRDYVVVKKDGDTIGHLQRDILLLLGNQQNSLGDCE